MSGRMMGRYIRPSGTIPYRPSILHIYKAPMPLAAHAEAADPWMAPVLAAVQKGQTVVFDLLAR